MGDAALLVLEAPRIAASAQPGQFVMVRIPNRPDMPAPRPFSVADADPKSGTISLLVKMRGKGTEILRNLKEPAELLLWGPCGRPFTLPEEGAALLVAGGIGVAPFIFLARRLSDSGVRTTAVFGARTAELLYLHQTLRSRVETLVLCTEDGSKGERATAVEAMKTRLKKGSFQRVYLCGPPGMVAAAIPHLKAAGIPTQVLVEGRMLCGLGVCACCATEFDGRLIRLCVDGAVCDLVV